MNFSVIIGQTQGVTISTDNGTGGVTYNQFIQSLGAYVYEVTSLYLYSQNFSQITGAISYSIFDSNGNKSVETIVSAPDPNQSQNAIYIDLKGKNLILNGNNNVAFNMLPNTSLIFNLYVKSVSAGYDMIKQNFLEVKNLLKKDVAMFQEYETGVSETYQIIEGRPVRKEDESMIIGLVEEENKEPEKKINFTTDNSSGVLIKFGIIAGAAFLAYKLAKK